MSDLAKRKCVPCEGGARPAGPEEIEELHREVPDWDVVERDGQERLERMFAFESFERALQFTNLVGQAAEDQGHHPVLVTEWGKVTVVWWTHAIGGLHQNDFVMAAKSDEIYRNMTG